ncbi:PREDICTED: uncharacterized protein LOC109206925 [Nicotiana attenuata]|uniref:uncharacterized protein LOC109206925 n=1 Tax=Nicotiana attenuata TaxID=49451 RepID=UPI0009055A25|nr:PREDICTED: uncharacterized protein LOC109206925 [Nicotiana attenuata]
MGKHIFLLFCKTLNEQYGLEPTRYMTVEEMAAMLLMMVGHGVGNRMIQERLQHTGETVSRYFHQVLLACLKLAMDIIKPKDPALSDVHTKLREDNRYWPYFKNCIGAIDGTHVPCIIPSKDQIKYIGRKGFTSQNIMVVCDWDMCFTFVWPGWEGTAHDARIFDQAVRRQHLNFPHPPAGYRTMLGYLGPYKGERYHLPDFGRNSSFKNPNEVHLVTSTMAIHNFIRRNSSTDVEFDHYANEDNMPELEEEDGQSDIHLEMQGMSSNVMELLHNRIRDDIIENSPNV